MHSGLKFSPLWGEPIQCPVNFCTLEAVALAEALANNIEDLLELENSESPGIAAQSAPPTPHENQAPATPRRPTKNHKKTTKDRGAQRATRELRGGGPKECALQYQRAARQGPLKSDASLASDLPRSKSAWVGLHNLKEDQSIYGLRELQEQYGLRLFEWDGRSVSFSTGPKPSPHALAGPPTRS
jgi:hypothetical protein